jgi:hypothetical protein
VGLSEGLGEDSDDGELSGVGVGLGLGVGLGEDSELLFGVGEGEDSGDGVGFGLGEGFGGTFGPCGMALACVPATVPLFVASLKSTPSSGPPSFLPKETKAKAISATIKTGTANGIKEVQLCSASSGLLPFFSPGAETSTTAFGSSAEISTRVFSSAILLILDSRKTFCQPFDTLLVSFKLKM